MLGFSISSFSGFRMLIHSSLCSRSGWVRFSFSGQWGCPCLLFETWFYTLPTCGFHSLVFRLAFCENLCFRVRCHYFRSRWCWMCTRAGGITVLSDWFRGGPFCGLTLFPYFFSPLAHSLFLFPQVWGKDLFVCSCISLYLISLWKKQQKVVLVFSSLPLMVVPVASFGRPWNLLIWREVVFISMFPSRSTFIPETFTESLLYVRVWGNWGWALRDSAWDHRGLVSLLVWMTFHCILCLPFYVFL